MAEISPRPNQKIDFFHKNFKKFKKFKVFDFLTAKKAISRSESAARIEIGVAELILAVVWP